jgi:dTDP-4-amino-4,6-dideoxygalactose transaminase
MINYGSHHIDQSDIKNVVKVLNSSFLTQGKNLNNFEKKLKTFFGAKYCCAVSTGTSALHLVMKSLNINKNDYVITTPITFLATANSVLYEKGNIEFVDIDPKSFNIDPLEVEKKIISLRRKKKIVKAIVAVDYAGNPCDWRALKKIAKINKIYLINDNCHAMGAKYNHDNKYAIKFADFVTQSFHPVKNITTGEGGAVLTNSKKFFTKISSLRNHGILNRNKTEKKFPWLYEMHYLGFNYRLNEISCALGISQLKKIKKFLSKRNKISKYYVKHLKNEKLISFQELLIGSTCANHLFPIRINFSDLKKNKSFFFKYMFNKGIKLQVHYIPLYLQPYYQKKKKQLKLINSYNFYKEQVSLPIYYDLSYDKINYVIRCLKEYLKKYAINN